MASSPKKDKVEVVMGAVKDLSSIVLGTNDDGTPRSIIDAKLALEKQRRKTLKKQSKTQKQWRKKHR